MSFASVHNGITSRNNGNEKESSSLSATTTSVVEMTGTNASSASPFSSQTTTPPVSAHDNNREPVVATTSNLHEVEEELDLNIISSHDMDLSMLQAATLLTADCMGTGLLALPQDIQVLGGTFGFIALIVNLPIAWYAGFLLSQTARRVEGKELYTDHDHDKEHDNEHHGHETIPEGDGLVRVVVSSAVKKAAYSSVEKGDNEESIANIVLDDDSNKPHRYDDSNTQDYIGITRVV
jgi:Transmembrane amino acid transporter protein